METPGNKFVFVVCGAATHIQTLHFSLERLKKYSGCEIMVVTDSQRNETPVHHDQILDISTPVWMNHHQAAIWLKTRLHRLLPEGPIYCYLDTDVVAVRPGVDAIFDHFSPPVTFCTDHCRLLAFSPNAVHDPQYDALLEKQTRQCALYYQFKKEDDRQLDVVPAHVKKAKDLKAAFNYRRPLHAQPLAGLTHQPLKILEAVLHKIVFHNLRFLVQSKGRLESLHRRIFGMPLDYDYFLAEHGYRYHPQQESWHDLQGNLLFEENYVVHRIESCSEFRWDRVHQVWRDEQGNNISQIESDKFHQLALEKFNVKIVPPDWQHWNGGVFLWDSSAMSFLDQWHEWSLAIMNDPAWKTRDQGTLAAAVWKFNLQDHPTLPLDFNFIADYYHPQLIYRGNLSFSFSDDGPIIRPFFLHIYHHFGDTSWRLWQDMEAMTGN